MHYDIVALYARCGGGAMFFGHKQKINGVMSC